MGRQIDLLATKIPKTRVELNALYLDLRRDLDKTFISGQGIVDVFNAVAQTSSAAGDKAGRAIEGILTRGKNVGRFGLNFGAGIDELQGTGISSQEVAQQLAKNLKIGLAEAQNLLASHRVKLDAGAKAVRDVVEKRFGSINSRLMLDLPTLLNKFKESLAALTSGVRLEPILEGFARLAKLFDVNTVTGGALKQMITDFSVVMGGAFKFALPLVEIFAREFVIGMLKIENVLLRVAVYLKETFGGSWIADLNLAEGAIFAAKAALASLAAVGVLAAGAGLAIAGAFTVGAAALYGAVEVGKEVNRWFDSVDWSHLGSNIIDGLVSGIKAGIKPVTDAIQSVTNSVKKAFTINLGIQSPSKVTEQYGKYTAQGYELGISRNAPDVQNAVSKLTALPPRSGGAAAGGNVGPVQVTLAFPNATNGADVQRTLTSDSFRREFISFLQQTMQSAGVDVTRPLREPG
jgi:hypothetical protein